MQSYIKFLALASIATVVAADEFNLKAKGGDVDGYGVSARHEGAGLSWGFLDTGAGNTFQINNGYLEAADMSQVAGMTWNAQFENSIFVVTPGQQDAGWAVVNGAVQYNGSADFYSCTGVQDMYNYGGAVVASAQVDGASCTKIGLEAVSVGSNSTSTSSTSQSAVASASVSSTEPAVVSASASSTGVAAIKSNSAGSVHVGVGAVILGAAALLF